MGGGSLGDEGNHEGEVRVRARESKEERKARRRRKKYSSTSGSDSSPSDSSYSSTDESSDEERRRREKRRKEKKRRKSHGKLHKSRDERRKDKKRRRKKHYRSDDSDDSSDSDRQKKRKILREDRGTLKKRKDNNVLKDKVPDDHKVAKIPEGERISEDHYFVKNHEFATWLREDRRMYFSDLSSDETHKLFLKFVDVWNAGKLNHKYYEGIKKSSRTGHNWAIKRGPEDVVSIDDEEAHALARTREKHERKKFRRDQEVVLDDLIPKATGRERVMEKKAIRREQARAREDSPDLTRERDVMGGGDDFHAKLARDKARREKREMERAAVYNEKRSAYQEKEAAAMDQFRALVSNAGGKITMAKRES